MKAYDIFDRTLTVSEANGLIHDTVEELFYELSIEGEVSGFRPASSGHWYFTLKDSSAAIDAAVFRSFQMQMMMPENGDLVVAKGSLSFYTKTGKLSFIIREMKKKGDGGLLEMIEKRKAYYRSLGYFDEDRKKPIPDEIEKLGVITSPTGAAIRDILNITKRRAPSLDIIIFPTLVQGDGAAENIAMRIRQANLFDACSVLIVGRGGGSAEDLSCFSEPAVIEAIHDSSIPIISAVGHEIDWPLSDYAADKRAPTPSAAAELVTETIFRRRERLEKALAFSLSAMNEKISDYAARLEKCRHSFAEFEKKILRLGGRIPSTSDLGRLLQLRVLNAETTLLYTEDGINTLMKKRLEDKEKKLDELLSESRALIENKMNTYSVLLKDFVPEIENRVRIRIKDNSSRLSALLRETEALSPLSILSRGYSVTMNSKGKIIRRAEDAAPGDEIITRMMDGSIKSIVKERI